MLINVSKSNDFSFPDLNRTGIQICVHDLVQSKISSAPTMEAPVESVKKNLMNLKAIAGAHAALSELAEGNEEVLTLFEEMTNEWKSVPNFPLEKVLNAALFAAEKHEGQVRKNPQHTPYIVHPLEVASIAWKIGGVKDANVQIMALLHDTLEDTEATEKEIETLFGKEVLRGVKDLTNILGSTTNETKKNQILHAKGMCKAAQIIKLSDRIANLSDLTTTPPEGWSQDRINRYFQWGEKLSQVISGVNAPLEDKLKSMVENQFFIPEVEVGKLGEKWHFPSDHLPVGITVNGIHMASWNVLNTSFMHWIDEGAQGLDGSLITEENVVVKPDGLTKRDQRVISMILEMINHPTHPKSLLGLQECSRPMLKALKQKLPEQFKIIESKDANARDREIILFDSEKLVLKEVKFDTFPCAVGKPITNATFVDKSGQHYTLMGAHVPGDPNLPGKDEFAAYLLDNQSPDSIAIGFGDINFNQKDMQEAFAKELKPNEVNPFHYSSKYQTEMGLHKEGKVIDLFLVDNFSNLNLSLSYLDADEVWEGLSATTNHWQ